jgi:hypothetical protein
MAMNNSPTKKVHFPIARDGDGFPPVDEETLWASKLPSGLYKLDNIPFFAKGVSCSDEVEADLVDGRLWFNSVAKRGGHSTIRIAVNDVGEVPSVREDLRRLGCATELSHLPRLVAVDIPGDVGRDQLDRFLREGLASDRFDYEDADPH